MSVRVCCECAYKVSHYIRTYVCTWTFTHVYYIIYIRKALALQSVTCFISMYVSVCVHKLLSA